TVMRLGEGETLQAIERIDNSIEDYGGDDVESGDDQPPVRPNAAARGDQPAPEEPAWMSILPGNRKRADHARTDAIHGCGSGEAAPADLAGAAGDHAGAAGIMRG